PPPAGPGARAALPGLARQVLRRRDLRGTHRPPAARDRLGLRLARRVDSPRRARAGHGVAAPSLRTRAACAVAERLDPVLRGGHGARRRRAALDPPAPQVTAMHRTTTAIEARRGPT